MTAWACLTMGLGRKGSSKQKSKRVKYDMEGGDNLNKSELDDSVAKAVESLLDDVTANQVLLKQVNDTLTSIRQENAELKEMVKQRDTIIESLTERVTTVEQLLRDKRPRTIF